MSSPSWHCTAYLLLLLLAYASAGHPPPSDQYDAPSPSPAPSSTHSPMRSPSPGSVRVPSPAPMDGSPFDSDNDDDGGAWYFNSPPPLPPAHNTPPFNTPESNTESESKTIAWCAIREEIKDCRNFVAMLNSASSYSWTCEGRDNAFECMQAIHKGEADVMSLDVGMAYIAFMNYQMKAIMMEEYCYFSKSYEAVAVVNKQMCDKHPHLSLKDFRGFRSCHSGYLTAAGWNYPIQFLVDSGLQKPPTKLTDETQGKDETVVASFFSSICAPSELEGKGLCTSCGNNGSCTTDSFTYVGYAGAFRCLVDGTGDITFVRSDTAERLSADGKHRQDWSTKPLDEFRYLCPQGGCRAINENIANCTFGSVPANVLMTRNSQPNNRRLEIVERLLNASHLGLLYNPQNWNDHVLSSSAQNLIETTDLTRHVLGDSAIAAQRVQNLGENRTGVSPLYPNGCATSTSHWFMAFLLTLLYFCLASQ